MTAPKNIQGRRRTWNTTDHGGFKACLDSFMDVHASRGGLYPEGVRIIDATGVGKTHREVEDAIEVLPLGLMAAPLQVVLLRRLDIQGLSQ
jgi:hypothetical protein